MRPAQRTVGWGAVFESREVRTVRSCFSPPSSGHRITTLLCTNVKTSKFKESYREFLLSYPRAWQFYCRESLHQLAHPMRASALREPRKRHCAPWHGTRRKYILATHAIYHISSKIAVVSDKTQREGQFRLHVTWQLYTPAEDKACKLQQVITNCSTSLQTAAGHYKLLFLLLSHILWGVKQLVKSVQYEPEERWWSTFCPEGRNMFCPPITLRGATSEKINRYLNI